MINYEVQVDADPLVTGVDDPCVVRFDVYISGDEDDTHAGIFRLVRLTQPVGFLVDIFGGAEVSRIENEEARVIAADLIDLASAKAEVRHEA